MQGTGKYRTVGGNREEAALGDSGASSSFFAVHSPV
jgi:hypothetical protein